MKSMFLVAGLATAAVAQEGLAACGQLCANNMNSAEKAQELGCSAGDIRCLCLNQNFLFGLRDCSQAVCGQDAEAAAAVLQYGLDLCAGSGVSISTGGDDGQSGVTETGPAPTDGQASATVTIFSSITRDGTTFATAIGTTVIGGEADDETASPIVSQVVSTVTNSDGEAVSTITEDVTVSDVGAIGSNVVSTLVSTITNSAGEAVSTLVEEVTITDAVVSGSEVISTFVSTITNSDGEAVSTVTGEVTVGGTDSEDDVSDVVSTIVGTITNSEGSVIVTTGTETFKGSASPVVTTFTTDGSQVVETLSTAVVPSGTGDADDSSDDTAATTTTSDNAGVPQKTAAPVGLIAAAGLAVLLL